MLVVAYSVWRGHNAAAAMRALPESDAVSSVHDIVSGTTAGTATAEAATRAALDVVAACDQDIGAWAYLDAERALAEARLRDRAAVKGALHGLPVGIKDVLDTADLPTAYGTPIYAGHRPDADAVCVALLRAAGAVVLGKTVTTELAMSHPGKTRNPLNPAHTPGGSSSGSAAAVASGMVPVALGTQTLGSVLRPASYCGIVGFKPSYGTINRGGMKLASESVDTIGIFARAVDDLPPVLAALAAAPADTFVATVDRPRIGIFRGIEWDKASPAAIAALDDAAKRLAKAGAAVTEIAVPVLLKETHEVSRIVTGYDLARAYSFEWFNHRAQLSPALAANIQAGLAVPLAEYRAAQAKAAAARASLDQDFVANDLWLTLSAADEAPLGLDATGDPLFNRLWTLLHVPALSLPYGKGARGLPLGLQLIGAPCGDARLLAAARWIERALR